MWLFKWNCFNRPRAAESKRRPWVLLPDRERKKIKGIIKSLGFNGYGFVQPFDDSPKVYFHANDIDRDFDLLVRGDVLEFDVVQTERGPECRCVSVLTPLRKATAGTGRIRTLCKGHGFIDADGGGDVFFHRRHSFNPTEADIGCSVIFQSVETDFGPQATIIYFKEKPGCTVGSHQSGTLAKIKRGFAFIAHDSGEIFCHLSQMPYRISEADIGRPVEFNVARNERGLIALKVRFTDE